MKTSWTKILYPFCLICLVSLLTSDGLPIPTGKYPIYAGDDRSARRFADDIGGVFLPEDIQGDPFSNSASGAENVHNIKLLSRKVRAADNSTEGSGDSGGIVGFFEDNNNKAMYLVLPLLVLVYGGCSAIYCVAKCRRYVRKCNRQKKHKLEQQQQQKHKRPDDGDGSRGNPDGKERGSTADENAIDVDKNGLDSRPASEISDSQSIPGQTVDYDDRVPLVAATARKHTPAPSEHNEMIHSLENTVAAKPVSRRLSRDSKTPSSVRPETTYTRQPDQQDESSMAARAALFTVSNSRRGSSNTQSGHRSNRDSRDRDYVSTPSTSTAGMPSHQDQKADFKAMLQGNYNPNYSHNADPWETMRAFEMKRMGQSNAAAPWSNQVQYDEFGRPKPQKKQRLIFVA